jgi:cell division transport system ATP-binding protein
MKVIEKINELGTTIVMATHDREMVDKMKKRVIYLEKGKLTKDYEKGSYSNNESV